MAYQKIDERFINGFKEAYIKHLSSADTQSENAAQKMLEQASVDDYGKISRIFDLLSTLHCVSREEFKTRMEEAGSIEAYMKPIINEIAKLLLTPDKARLNDEVIRAIGVDNYCRLVKGKNIAQEDGIQIVAAEKLLAESFLRAILACYSLSVYENNVLAEERTRGRLEEQMTALKFKIQPEGEFPSGWEELNLISEDITLKEFDEQAKLIIAQSQIALNGETEAKDLWPLLKKCQALYSRGTQLLHESNVELGAMTNPLQQLGFRLSQGTGSDSIFDLKEQSRKQLTYPELKAKVSRLQNIIELFEPKIHSPELKETMNKFREQLKLTQHYISEYEMEYGDLLQSNVTVPVHALSDALNSYNAGTSNFMKAVNEEDLKKSLKPYEMNIVQRLINIVSKGYFFASARNYENSSLKMKNELIEMKSKYDESPEDQQGFEFN